jgi:hypothetical protein
MCKFMLNCKTIHKIYIQYNLIFQEQTYSTTVSKRNFNCTINAMWHIDFLKHYMPQSIKFMHAL